MPVKKIFTSPVLISPDGKTFPLSESHSQELGMCFGGAMVVDEGTESGKEVMEVALRFTDTIGWNVQEKK